MALIFGTPVGQVYQTVVGTSNLNSSIVAVAGNPTASVTISGNTNGEYVKVGSIVYIRGYIQNTSVTGGQSWQADIAGLPFTPNTGGYGIYAISCLGSNWSYNSGYYGLTACVNESHTSVFLRASNSQGHGFTPTAYNMTNTTSTYIAGCYHIAGNP